MSNLTTKTALEILALIGMISMFACVFVAGLAALAYGQFASAGLMLFVLTVMFASLRGSNSPNQGFTANPRPNIIEFITIITGISITMVSTVLFATLLTATRPVLLFGQNVGSSLTWEIAGLCLAAIAVGALIATLPSIINRYSRRT